jgi:hypothetical protein
MNGVPNRSIFWSSIPTSRWRLFCHHSVSARVGNVVVPVLSNHQFVMRREVQLPSPFADPPANKVAGGKPKEQAAVEPVIASTVTRS